MYFLQIRHKCGHDESHPVAGGKAERDRLVALQTGRTCTECHRSAQARRHGNAAAWAKQAGLPALSGTPREVAEAEVIRHETLTSAAAVRAIRRAEAILCGSEEERAKLPAGIRQLLGHPTAGPALNAIAARTLDLVGGLRAETSAAWWEAHRRNSAWTAVEAEIQHLTMTLRVAIRSAA